MPVAWYKAAIWSSRPLSFAKRIKKILQILKVVINYDYLYIGGGNSDKLHFKLDKNIKIVFNEDGIKGGPRLWRKDDARGLIASGS